MPTHTRLRKIVGNLLAVIICASAILLPGAVSAQDLLLEKLASKAKTKASEPSVQAVLTPIADDRVSLAISVVLEPESYTYSTNPSFGGATRITITRSDGMESIGTGFQTDHPPKTEFEPLLGQEIEKLYNRITWRRAYRITSKDRVDPIAVAGKIEFQVCDGRSCRQFAKEFQATASAANVAEKPNGTVSGQKQIGRATDERHPFGYTVTPTRGQGKKAQPEPITWRFQLEPETATAGQRVTLSLTAMPKDGWHIYAQTQDPANYGNPTVITLDQLTGLSAIDNDFVPNRDPEIKSAFDGKEQQFYHGEVVWTRQFEVLPATSSGEYGVRGKISYQVCDAGSCRTGAVAFALGADSPEMQTAPAEPRLGLGEIHLQHTSVDNQRMAAVLLTAFLAGFILNFMPCVLPVIGLKIMAFVQQAGDSRGRVFVMNLWFSLGLMSVFLVLATLAVFLQMGWGAQFSSITFNIILTAVVFVFALSFLGVWEIPIPGFVGSGKAAELSQREGAAGAFTKGILTTVLATPCSGPMLGPALAWAVSQPPLMTYAGFVAVGAGMASPYLLIGAFPQLLSFLPKPGAWMDTFKNIMGFVLLGTVVFLLTFIDIPYVVPTVAFLIGLWAACWWIGRTPLTERLGVRLKAWMYAGAFAVLIGLVSFDWLHGIMTSRFEELVDRELANRNVTVGQVEQDDDDDELPWRPFSRKLLDDLIAQEKTVLVDFTADWCLTCKANEAVALNRTETRELVDALGVATLKADKTRTSPEADEMLKLLGNKNLSVPFYAIFPAANPNEPILLDGVFLSPDPILDALREAGPSRDG